MQTPRVQTTRRILYHPFRLVFTLVALARGASTGIRGGVVRSFRVFLPKDRPQGRGACNQPNSMIVGV